MKPSIQVVGSKIHLTVFNGRKAGISSYSHITIKKKDVREVVALLLSTVEKK